MTTQNKNEAINFSLCVAAVILIIGINWMFPVIPKEKSFKSVWTEKNGIWHNKTIYGNRVYIDNFLVDTVCAFQDNPFHNHSEIKGVTGCIGITSKFGDE